MRVTRLNILVIILSLAFIQGTSFAQTVESGGARLMVDISIHAKSIDLAFDTFSQDSPPDSIRMEALEISSGYLNGIPFHYERNRDKLSVFEQIETVTDSLEYNGFSQSSNGDYIFNYSLWVDNNIYDHSRRGDPVQGHGVSDLQNTPDARAEARNLALKDAVRAAINRNYTQRGQVIPGILDGRILWHDTFRDEYDFESGYYVFDLDAWVRFETDD